MDSLYNISIYHVKKAAPSAAGFSALGGLKVLLKVLKIDRPIGRSGSQV